MRTTDAREDLKRRIRAGSVGANENQDMNAPSSTCSENCDATQSSPPSCKELLSPAPCRTLTPTSLCFDDLLPASPMDARYSRRLKPRGSSTTPSSKPPRHLEDCSSLPPLNLISSFSASLQTKADRAPNPTQVVLHTHMSLENPSISLLPAPLSDLPSVPAPAKASVPDSDPDYTTPPSSPTHKSLREEDTTKSPPRCCTPSKSSIPRSPEKLMRSNSDTPTQSPTKQVYSDRFIPSRSGSNLDGALASFQPLKSVVDSKEEPTCQSYNMLLRNGLLGKAQESLPQPPSSTTPKSSPASSPTRTFRYKSPMKAVSESPFVSSPVGLDSQRLLSSPRKTPRKIHKSPSKVLDAPSLIDDFYLNLVDWSSQNILAVGLSSCVYMWSACTSKVQKLCDLGDDSVTSVSWNFKGNQLAVGTRAGYVQLWDVAKETMVRSTECHTARVGALSWTSQTLASGSRDRTILLHDARTAETNRLRGHKQEVCGLRWNHEEDQLASGGNDNKLVIWDAHSATPLARFGQHTAAVKAIAWSPHQRGLLASGGGTADKHIRFWNTLTCVPTEAYDTGSQVCNLMWSKTVNEIVSTHGFSLNQIIVWKYPSMTQVATLTGHTYRVLYLAMSPDGQTIVTGAGDETLRFWNLFPSSKPKGAGSQLFFPGCSEIR